MAIGHWTTLANCQKLTESQLIPGVIEEDIKRNNVLDRIPVAQALGQTIKWNREQVVMEADIDSIAIGDELSWSASMTYDQQEVALKRKYVQRRLDAFIPDVYGTINNYEAQVLWEMKKAMVRRIGDDVWYDDLTYGDSASGNEFDGLHALAQAQFGTDLDIDEGDGALSLHNLRLQHDAMKAGIDFCYMPYVIARRMDEAYQEAGFVGLNTTTASTMGMISYGVDDMGKRVMFFDGVPILRTDFLMEETGGTGVSANTNARAQNTSGNNWSVFHVKFGDVFNGEPGLTLGFGNTEMLGQFYKIVTFEDLENYDAGGIRLVSYIAPLLGSKLALGRIYDVTDAAVTA